jgi:hypothetical protein
VAIGSTADSSLAASEREKQQPTTEAQVKPSAYRELPQY